MLDLGLDDGPPSPGRSAPPPASTGPDLSNTLGESGVLDEIDDTAQRAGGDSGFAGQSEFKIRHRNGRVEGPFGVNRLRALLKSGELKGNEDISDDGLHWRAMTSNLELNQTINELSASSDPMDFGNVDLPMPGGDLPAPSSHRNLPTNPSPSASGGFGAGGPGMGGAVPGAQATGRETSLESIMDDLDLDGDEPAPPLSGPSAPATSAPDEALPDLPQEEGGAVNDELEVGEIPDLPPIWQTYRKPILVFFCVMLAILIGVFTHLFTPYGAFGIPGLVAAITYEAPPPPPPKPPPPPAKVADPKEIANLIDEGSYEAFRSVFATVQKAGPKLPDNMLASAKARGFATLSYGPEIFPVDKLKASVEALNTLDLAKAMGGNASLANVEILKARSALEIATGSPENAAQQLEGLLSQRTDDKELALLLGLARQKAGDQKGALAALDKAIVASSKYAPALHAIGEIVEKTQQENALSDASEWFMKAIEAEPAHARSGLKAAEIHRKLKRHGHYRKTMALTASKVTRGLPPDARAELLYKAAQVLDRDGRTKESLPIATEAARLDPGNYNYVAAANVARAASGDPQKAIAELSGALKRSPNHAAMLIARARAYFLADDVAKAFLDLVAARKISPKDFWIPLWEARFNLKLGKLNDGKKALLRAVKLSGNDPTPYIELGRFHLSLGDVDAAFTQAQEAVKLAQDDPSGQVLLGACYERRGQLSKAKDTYATAVEMDEENLDARLGLANVLREMASREKVPSESLNLARAMPVYLTTLRSEPKNPKILFEYGRALELIGDLSAALALYRDAATFDEKDVRPHLRMVAAYAEQAEPDVAKAKASLKRAKKIELQEGGRARPDVRYWEARVALLEGRKHDAVAAMRLAVDAEPRNSVYAFWMGKVLEANSSLYEAITFYKKAVELNSRMAEAHRAIGWTHMERNHFAQARTAFDEYRKSAPEDKSIYVDIGESFTRQNRDDDALKAFKTALKHMPKNTKALLQVGNILSRKGSDKEAIRYFGRAVRAEPSNGTAWCQLGLSRSFGKMNKDTKNALKKCVSMENAPEDMKRSAQDVLDTSG